MKTLKQLTLIEWAIIAVIALILLSIVGSCNRQVPVYQQPVVSAAPVAVAPAPVVVHSGGDGFFSGMLAGHLMSSGSSTQTVNKNVTVTHVNQPAPTAAPVAPKVTAPVPTPSPTRYTSTSSYRPSTTYSSSRSYSGGRR